MEVVRYTVRHLLQQSGLHNHRGQLDKTNIYRTGHQKGQTGTIQHGFKLFSSGRISSSLREISGFKALLLRPLSLLNWPTKIIWDNNLFYLMSLYLKSADFQFSSVQFSSVAQSCPILCDPMNHSTPGLPVHHQLPEFTQTHVHRVGDAIQPSHSLSSLSPPAPNPSQHQSFFNESTLLMRWPKYWSFSFSISPSNEHPGLISFRMNWQDLLAV